MRISLKEANKVHKEREFKILAGYSIYQEEKANKLKEWAEQNEDAVPVNLRATIHQLAPNSDQVVALQGLLTGSNKLWNLFLEEINRILGSNQQNLINKTSKSIRDLLNPLKQHVDFSFIPEEIRKGLLNDFMTAISNEQKKMTARLLKIEEINLYNKNVV